MGVNGIGSSYTQNYDVQNSKRLIYDTLTKINLLFQNQVPILIGMIHMQVWYGASI